MKRHVLFSELLPPSHIPFPGYLPNLYQLAVGSWTIGQLDSWTVGNGTMEQWNNGTMEQWNNGTMEQENNETKKDIIKPKIQYYEKVFTFCYRATVCCYG